MEDKDTIAISQARTEELSWIEREGFLLHIQDVMGGFDFCGLRSVMLHSMRDEQV